MIAVTAVRRAAPVVGVRPIHARDWPPEGLQGAFYAPVVPHRLVTVDHLHRGDALSPNRVGRDGAPRIAMGQVDTAGPNHGHRIGQHLRV
jgi:hypothetical protein